MKSETTEDILELMNGSIFAAFLCAAMEFGLFWLLADQSLSAPELAQTLNIPLNRCHYWLHLLCKQGLLEDSGEGYAPSTIAREAILNVQRQDYYQGVAALNPGSENLSMSGLLRSQQHTLRQLVEELKTPGLEQSRHDEILDIILANIRQNRGTLYK